MKNAKNILFLGKEPFLEKKIYKKCSQLKNKKSKKKISQEFRIRIFIQIQHFPDFSKFMNP